MHNPLICHPIIPYITLRTDWRIFTGLTRAITVQQENSSWKISEQVLIQMTDWPYGIALISTITEKRLATFQELKRAYLNTFIKTRLISFSSILMAFPSMGGSSPSAFEKTSLYSSNSFSLTLSISVGLGSCGMGT